MFVEGLGAIFFIQCYGDVILAKLMCCIFRPDYFSLFTSIDSDTELVQLLGVLG